jgi:hypothetical protein
MPQMIPTFKNDNSYQKKAAPSLERLLHFMSLLRLGASRCRGLLRWSRFPVFKFRWELFERWCGGGAFF